MIVDAERRPLPRGQAGYIASPTPATGYFNDPLATARAFYTVQGVQYVIPGDFGVLEDDGTITLLGRGTSTINTGGEKVFPGEVEDAFLDIPGVDDCLVFGLDDDRFNERVCAIVQSSAEAEMLDESVLLSSARQRLAGYKLPRQVIMAPVPRLPNGKPDYQTAKEMATASPAPLNTAKELDR
jgi:fatty-acyl-CoA synthase